MKTCHSTIEPLESRIAPAAVVVTYTDVDGDKVKITDSSGTLTSADLTFVSGTSGQLAELNLTATGFAGANITFSVTHEPGGNGLANVGYIDAGSNNLGSVTVKGDLGRIDAGSGSATIPAIKSLTVNSLGRLGTDTQSGLASPDLESNIKGALGSLTVTNDENGAFIDVTNGGIGAVTIGGSLIGGSEGNSGEILSSGNMGAVKIGHDLQGGSGGLSGGIQSGGALASVTIGGSLIGGSGNNSGEISSSGDMGAVRISGNFTGGSVSGTTGPLDSSGLILSKTGSIASVAIGGSVISGTDTSFATDAVLTDNASIRAAQEIGSLAVGGSVVGNPDGAPNGAPGGANAASPVVISAGGLVKLTAKTDVAIGSIAVGGRVEDAVILAGYNTSLTATSGSAQIGAVRVDGAWIASDLVAGATNSDKPSGLPFPFFGNSSDAMAGGATAGIISKIASITIRGQVFGTPASVNGIDNFGFVAEAIGPVTIGGYAIPIASGNNPQPVGETGDVDIHVIT